MGWLIALAVIAGVVILILRLPLGVRFIYNQDGLRAWYTVLSIRVSEVDLEDTDSKYSIRNMLRTIRSYSQKKNAAPHVNTSNSKIKEFWEDLIMVLEFYWGLLDVAILKRLELRLTMCEDDPYDLAIHYGQAQAALGAVVVALEKFVNIRKKDVQVVCDFVGTESTFTARLDFKVSLGRLIGYLFLYVKNNIK